jgi:amino acid adenylation domain-containing protein
MNIPVEHEGWAPIPEIFTARRPEDLCFHHLIESKAEQSHTIADTAAVVHGERSITYHDLDRRASRLALSLAALGVEPEVTVGIYAPRSPEAIIAMLAVSKAGGAFLPLDPSYPLERLAFMIEDAAVRVILAHGELPERLAAAAPCVTSLDAEPAPLIDPSIPDPSFGLGGRQTAYVMYTSGSTGRPKGVAVSQRSLVHYLRKAVAEYAIGPSDRVLQFSSLSFDASLEEIGIALAAGACLVLRDDAMLGSASRFLAQCRAWGITAAGIPTAYWHELVLGLDAQDLAWPPSLRLVIIGSERALPERFEMWRRQVGRGVRLMNTYGPTEATIVATMCDLAAEVPCQRGELPIGHPIPDVQVLLLDEEGRAVVPGEAGEIYLGGEGLARGYFGRPDLTAERFLPHGSGGAGERLYATGDLAWLRPDGGLEFAGRKDRQVKLRGFRIELSEIERVLARHPLVEAAVAAVRGDQPGERRLAAYVVPTANGAGDAGDLVPSLRAWAREHLPEFMVPARFVLLDRLPLTPNGKVDLAALPAPEEAGEGAAPRNALEERVAAVWSEVLGVRRIGIHDGFLESGGDSLSALQLAGRLQEMAGVDVTLETVLSNGTIARIAEFISLGGASGGAASLHVPPPIVPQPRTGPLPVSFQQQAIWLMSQMAGASVPYNNQLTIRLTGALDVRALTRAFTEIVARHEVFRTSIAETDQGLVQSVHAPWPCTAPVADLSGLPAAVRADEAERRVRAECARPFDLGRFPLVRWTLLRLAPEEHLLIQVEQHFGHDGWSLARLLGEVSALYEAFVAGRPSPLVPLPIQFADYAVWQRRWMRGAVLETYLDHWRRRLDGCPPVLELPADRPRPKNQSFQGRTRVRALSPELSRELRAASRREGSTLFVTLLAAFQALVHRYTASEDFALGSAVANRARPETRELIGMMANAVVLRSDLSGRPSFRALSRRVREGAFDAYAYQELPFELLVEDLHHCRDNSRNPIFQVMFSFHDAELPDLRLPGLTGALEYRYNESAKFDLDITVIPGRASEETRIEWEHSTDLFDAATIERMTRHYETLLRGALAEPARRVADLPLMTEEELAQARAEWQDLRGPGRTMPDLAARIAAQVERAPEAVAVISGGRRLTYRELAERSHGLAATLTAQGIDRGSVVALLCHRGADFLTSVLALLEIGAAYLPLDPGHPIQRLAGIVRQSRVREVLAEDGLAERIESALAEPLERRDRPAVLRLGTLLDAPLDSETAADRRSEPAAGEDLAYVIYTSGSTGEPKGAMVTRQGMLNHLAGKIEHLGLTAKDVVAQTASQAFDISVWQFLAPLLTGGTAVVLDEATVRDPQALLAAAESAGVTILEIVPSMLRFLLDELRAGEMERPALRSLRCLVVTAEALPADLCRRWLEIYPGISLLNAYGPTECSDDVTHHVIAGDAADVAPDRPRVPIGRPLPDVHVHVLDREGHPVPAGVAGELCVGGVAVGRGYLHNPAKTAESFVPDSYAGGPGGRLYRTGDLARHLADGAIEYLGRFDHQVKLRGYRIELEEVEAALTAHPAIRAAVVILRRDPGTEDCLTAYLVCDGGAEPSDLRSHLWNRLPESMIPQYFVTLPALPLNANGKVDRAKLPAPDRGSLATAAAAPMSRTEEVIAGLWRQILRIENVAAHSNFWELGGHSIEATTVLLRLRRALGVDLRLPAFFQAPTVERLAQVIDAAL